MGKLSLFKGYLHYWLHAVNRHSLHAPFVYHFYTEIICNDQTDSIFDQIERQRQAYLHDHTVISVNSPGAVSQLTKKNQRKVSSIARHSLSNAKFSRLLYRLASSKKTKVVIELGTSLGINTLYLSAAYPEAKIYTFEGCPQTAELARKLFKSWHIQNIALIEGNINETLPQLLSQIQQVDLVYQDANHRYAPTLHYYDMLYERATQESIFIVDDIYWSSGMHKAWKNLISRTEVTLSIDLFDAGFLFFKPSLSKQRYTLMF